MKIFKTIDDIRRQLADDRGLGLTIGLVATM